MAASRHRALQITLPTCVSRKIRGYQVTHDDVHSQSGEGWGNVGTNEFPLLVLHRVDIFPAREHFSKQSLDGVLGEFRPSVARMSVRTRDAASVFGGRVAGDVASQNHTSRTSQHSRVTSASDAAQRATWRHAAGVKTAASSQTSCHQVLRRVT